MQPTLVILAAGIGSRYGGLKQLDQIGPGGETIVDYSIYDAMLAGFKKVIFVIKEGIEKDFTRMFIDKLSPVLPVGYVLQEIWKVPEGIRIPPGREKPWGTGHAVLMAQEMIDGPFAVINSDDFYGRGAYEALVSYYKDWQPFQEINLAMVGYQIGNTLSDFGSVSRGVCRLNEASQLAEVVERTQIEKDAQGIFYLDDRRNKVYLPDGTVVSMNFWGFTPAFFQALKTGFEEFIKKYSSDTKVEYYIPFAVNHLIQSGKASVTVLRCSEKWFGMTYQEDRPVVIENIRRLIKNGVYPEKLWK